MVKKILMMRTVPAKLTPKLIAEIDELVKAGWYASRSEALRDGARNIVEKHKLKELEKAVTEDNQWALHGNSRSQKV